MIQIWTYHWDYFFVLTIITNNNPSLKIYCENIVDITFHFLTQYKFKIFFFLFPPFTGHSTATHHIWINFTFLFIYLFILFPKASISQGLIYTTPLKKISAPSQPPTFYIFIYFTFLHFFPFFCLLTSFLPSLLHFYTTPSFLLSLQLPSSCLFFFFFYLSLVFLNQFTQHPDGVEARKQDRERKRRRLRKKVLDREQTRDLESTDTAPEVPHPCLMRRDAGHGVWRDCPHVGPRLRFFFFFSDSRRLGSIRADAARFVPNRLRFMPNRADSAQIGPYRPYPVVSAGSRYGRNRPENARNTPETAEIGLEYGQKSWNLHSSFFFCESRHSMCFLRIF